MSEQDNKKLLSDEVYEVPEHTGPYGIRMGGYKTTEKTSVSTILFWIAALGVLIFAWAGLRHWVLEHPHVNTSGHVIDRHLVYDAKNNPMCKVTVRISSGDIGPLGDKSFNVYADQCKEIQFGDKFSIDETSGKWNASH